MSPAAYPGENFQATLVFSRHGESEWNVANIFTGWVDVDLSEKGLGEAKGAGELLKADARCGELRKTWEERLG